MVVGQVFRFNLLPPSSLKGEGWGEGDIQQGFFVIKKISVFVLATFIFSSCGFRTQIHDAHNVYRQLKENAASSPPEYYAQAEPASFSPENLPDTENISSGLKATQSDTRDGHEKKTQYILIGTLAGLALVAGIVIPIVLLKK